MNKFINIIALALLVLPVSIFAAEINFNQVGNIGDSNIVEVRIDPKSKNINVVEGAISVDFEKVSEVSEMNQVGDTKDINIEIENGNSILSLWPIVPKYNSDEKEINFTGGLPLGFNKEGLLFRIKILSSQYIGNVKLAWAGGTAYLNDGKGTKESISSQPLTISLNNNTETPESNIENENSNKIESTDNSSGLNRLNNATILLLSIIVLVVLFYAYKKIVKNKNTL